MKYVFQQKDFEKYLDFHRSNGGTGKIFNFKFIKYSAGFLKLEAEFPLETLNPNGSVQGGQMTSMLDDVTSLLLIYESQGAIYPSSINLSQSSSQTFIFLGKVIATAEVVTKGKNIATLKGELYNSDDKLATILMHTVVLIKSDFDFYKI